MLKKNKSYSIMYVYKVSKMTTNYNYTLNKTRFLLLPSSHWFQLLYIFVKLFPFLCFLFQSWCNNTQTFEFRLLFQEYNIILIERYHIGVNSLIQRVCDRILTGIKKKQLWWKIRKLTKTWKLSILRINKALLDRFKDALLNNVNKI